MKKLLLFIFLFMVSIISAQNLPEKIIVGYWHNWQYSPNTVYLHEIPDAYDIVNIAFATPTIPSGASMEFVPDPEIYPDVNDFIDDVSWLQSQDKKVVISIGGANDPISLNTPADVQEFLTTMSSILDTYGFDGIDIDLEGGSVFLDAGDTDFRSPTTTTIVNLIDAITQLIDLYPDMILSTAPETAYVQGGYGTYGGIWGAYLPIIHALRDNWTYVHVQHYNTGSMFGRDGFAYEPASADFHVAMADMLLAGFNVDVWGENIFFNPLSHQQVATGLPASSSAAGSGYTNTTEVESSLDYIILGNSFGGQYQLANPEGYEDFRGLMTWSINWDIANNLEFADTYRPYLDDLMGVAVHEFNIIKKNVQMTNYPNPFNPSTTISFNVTQSSYFATIEIYNLKGQKVRTFPIYSSIHQPINSVTWNGTDQNDKPVSSGIYFALLKAKKQTATRKMLLLK